MKQNQRTHMENGQNKNQWIKLFDLCVKIKSGKGKLFQFSGEWESVREYMSEKVFGKQVLLGIFQKSYICLVLRSKDWGK